MTYIQKTATNATITPFDIAKMSGGTAIGSDQIYDTFNVSWITLDTSTGALESITPFFSEACFSPNSNSSGGARVGLSGSALYEQGQILPESSNTSAGGSARGDDISFAYGVSQFQSYLYKSTGLSTAPDTALTYLKIMRM